MAKPRRCWCATATPALGQHGYERPGASDALYVEALAAPDTINTMLEKTLGSFAEQSRLKDVLPTDSGDAEDMVAEFAQAGVDDAALAALLQREGTEAFTKSRNDLMSCLAAKSVTLKKTHPAGGRR